MSYTANKNGIYLPDAFFEGRNPPLHLHPESQDCVDWYNEQIRRSFEGFEYKGQRVTGDFYWYTNFFPIIRLAKPGRPETTFDMPWASQEDDYLFKQIEEAEQDSKFVMFFTSRGFGKTYAVISVGAKYYFNVEDSHNIFSASSENHIKETYNNKLLPCIDEINRRHPALRKNTAKRDDTDLISGVKAIVDGEDQFLGFRSRCERIIYGNKEGATKGRRPTFQLLEEVGDWSGAAKLKDCWGASRGSFFRGSVKTARVFLIGTGGQMKSGGSRDAKDMFYNPEAFNIYSVNEWKKPTAMFIPSERKYGGFWEQTGISDIEGARVHLEKEREKKKADPVEYYKFIQEYPFTPEECFLVQGANIFDQYLIAQQYVNIQEDPDYQKVETGNLHWVRNHNGKIMGVEWEKNPNGKIKITEHPEKDPEGNGYKNLYIAGYDGIDIGAMDSESGKGSNASMHVKKRFLSTQRTHNIYVCEYTDRPNDVEENYENALKIAWYYDCQINIEFSRVRIVGYFREKKQSHRLMPRPSISSSDITNYNVEKANSKLIGTIMNEKMKDYGQQAVAKYIKNYHYQMFFPMLLEELRDYTPDEQTRFDRVVSFMLTEIADDEMMTVNVREQKKVGGMVHFGYYTDPNGIRRYGKIPGKLSHEDIFGKSTQGYIDHIDITNSTIVYK